MEKFEKIIEKKVSRALMPESLGEGPEWKVRDSNRKPKSKHKSKDKKWRNKK